MGKRQETEGHDMITTRKKNEHKRNNPKKHFYDVESVIISRPAPGS